MAGIAAKSYCDAIFDLAKEEQKLDAFKEQLDFVEHSIISDQKFQAVLHHPKIKKDEKKDVLTKIYQEVVDPMLLNFLKLLIDKGRFQLLSIIHKEFVKRYNIENNIQVVYVKSAVALDDAAKNDVIHMLEDKTKKKIQLQCSIDPDLIAGIRIKVNDQIIDNTALSKLTRLKKQVVDTVTINK